MSRMKRRSRMIATTVMIVIVGAALGAAFWPRPALVDLGDIVRGRMTVTIDAQGRTRVAEAYVVSTPVAGRLQRVQVHAGDQVVGGETIVAHMLPTNPAALDVRTREQALAAVQAAQAALRVAEADLNAAIAGNELAKTELSRTEQLVERQIASQAALDQALQGLRVSEATVEIAEAAIEMRRADLSNARAQLIGFDDQGLAAAIGDTNDDIPLYAPADGRILRIIQESETTLPVGAPIMEIGDIAGELEVAVELLSSDAVKVAVGNSVIIDDWGGSKALAGIVDRIDPFAITKYSSLGVEEQRVPVTVSITSPVETHAALGHGYRVEARIVIWEDQNALIVPASALFRNSDSWAVFVASDGRAVLRDVEIGQNNGVSAQVLLGLSEGDQVVLYPSAAIVDGHAIAERSLQAGGG